MDRKKSVAIFIIGIVLLCFIAGCVPGRVKIGRQGSVTVSDLIDNWHDYDVFLAGSSYRPIAILFDPKNDGFKLVGSVWTKVEDERTLSNLANAIQPGTTLNSIIIRRNDQLVGYYSRTQYTSTDYYYHGHTYNPIAREIDETTIQVDLIREDYPKRNY
jgi:hypothetical protein